MNIGNVKRRLGAGPLMLETRLTQSEKSRICQDDARLFILDTLYLNSLKQFMKKLRRQKFEKNVENRKEDCRDCRPLTHR